MKVNGISAYELKLYDREINKLKSDIILARLKIKNLQAKKEGKRI